MHFAMDLTQQYWAAVVSAAQARGLGDVSTIAMIAPITSSPAPACPPSQEPPIILPVQEELRKLRSAQLLRSLGAKNDFTKAAVEVAQNVASLRAFLAENQQLYAQQGRLRESERDAIEEQAGAYVRACSSNIAKLQELLKGAPAASPAARVSPSADLTAHRQGMVLILSERLGALISAFDRLRSLRYKQLQASHAVRRRRLPQGGPTLPNTTAGLHAQLQSSRPQPGAPAQQVQQVQTQVDPENVALQLELMSMSDSVQSAERTVREIATLNQMFSAAILHQSEQIEKLYSEAVAATGNISYANVQLGKAIKTNKSAQKCMLVLLLLASAALLFLDWWYS